MAWKEASDLGAGDATKYGAPDLKKLMSTFNGNDETEVFRVIVDWEIDDDHMLIVDPASPTKRARLDVGGVTAGQTRVLTVQDSNHTLVGKDTTDVLTNKSIDQDGTGNSITNIANASIKSSAAIDATKIADGTVNNTEFQYINSLSSNAQTQINGKVTSGGALGTPTSGDLSNCKKYKETIMLAVTDPATAITSGTAKVSFRMPYAFTLTEVIVSAHNHDTTSTMTVDINDDGTTLGTNVPISLTTTSLVNQGAASNAIADDSIITIDCDAAGTDVLGVVVYLVGYQP